jgi:hypothetical protein
MHAQELCLKHALGLVERRKNGKTVDSFPQGLKLRDQARKFASLVMDKKVKKRYKDYCAYSQNTWNVDALKLVVPSETRVSGCYSLFESLLRAKPLIQAMMSSNSFDYLEGVAFTPDRWKMMAEFESVMKSLFFLSRQTQKNDVGEICFIWYDVCLAKYRVKLPTMCFDVIDTTKSWNPTCERDHIPRARLTRNQLLSDTQEFLGRLVKEFETYFPEPDDDSIVAMKLHPVMVKWGFETLDILNDVFCNKEAQPKIDDKVVEFTFNLYKDGIPEMVRLETEKREKEFMEGVNETGPGNDNLDSDEEDVLQKLLQKERSRREKMIIQVTGWVNK